jgi:hypothetical protein
MQKAVLFLIKANTDNECELSTCLKLLGSRPSKVFLANKLLIDQAQCDQLAGWARFSQAVFEKDPNVCCKPPDIVRGSTQPIKVNA